MDAAIRNIGGDLAPDVNAALASALTRQQGKAWVVVPVGPDSATQLHTILESGSPNVGVVLTTSNAPASQIDALRACEYGGCYVAAVKADFVVAIAEAARFMEGPSVVLCADGAAAEDPNWTGFTYDPRREANGMSAFLATTDTVRKEIAAFMARENLLTLIAHRSLPVPKAEAGAEDLAGGLGDASKTITILYSSDTGHGEECAKAIARQCRSGGFANSAVRVATMDSFDMAALAAEPQVVFCVATAGKGEFAGNGRQFWEKLSAQKPALAGLKYALFALGDSHYWGKGTEDSKINFAKSGRDMDDLLEECGAVRFMPTGYGDDQDVDQYHTGFGEWKVQLFSKLGVERSAGGAADGDDGPVQTDEIIKVETKQLRGSLKESLDDVTTGQIPFHDTKLIKSHGSYQQDDRDLREERQKMGLENAFSFMIRVRLPGGYCTAEQWLAMDDICGRFANGTLKITTRQTWQVHGVLKRDVKETMRAMNRACMDTLAACGDVCRNVMCTSDPRVCSPDMMKQILDDTYAIHDHCLPRSGAYHEIFLMTGKEMEEKHHVMGSTPLEEEPLYGLTYLPRKFKVAVAIPPSNDVDVFAHCVGFIAIIQGDKLLGYNVSVGGGLGFTHNNQKTFPRLGQVIGFCEVDDAKHVCACIMTVQRDLGDRTGRKHARVKYTVEDYGPERIREYVEERLGKKLGAERAYHFERRGDLFGWHKTPDGLWHCGVLLPIGRVKNNSRDALKLIADELVGTSAGFRMTCNQGLCLTEIPADKKDVVTKILDQHKVVYRQEDMSGGLRRNMVACVALPTCPLAFAEAERYLPTLVDRLETVAEKVGLREQDISIRMTGCPNSCGRPSMGEIGFIGKAPGTYNMYLGADFAGARLNTLYRESVTEDQIVQLLTPLFSKYSQDRQKGETFGNWCIRASVVKPMNAGRDWWTLPEV